MFITSITIITALLGVICPAEREDAFSFVWANNETRKLLGETHNSTNSYLSFDYKNDLKLVKRIEVENEGSEFLEANNEFSSTSDGIYGDDDRVFLQNNEYTYYPFKAVCQLFVSYDNFVGTYLGTGASVGPNILLTAAHMVYDAQKGWAHLVAKPRVQLRTAIP
jgi:V8-like Glu-specific endopeptidase